MGDRFTITITSMVPNLTPRMHTNTNARRRHRDRGGNSSCNRSIPLVLNAYNFLLLRVLIPSNLNRLKVIQIHKGATIELLRCQGFTDVQIVTLTNLLTSNKKLRRTNNK